MTKLNAVQSNQEGPQTFSFTAEPSGPTGLAERPEIRDPDKQIFEGHQKLDNIARKNHQGALPKHPSVSSDPHTLVSKLAAWDPFVQHSEDEKQGIVNTLKGLLHSANLNQDPQSFKNVLGFVRSAWEKGCFDRMDRQTLKVELLQATFYLEADLKKQTLQLAKNL